MNRDQLKRFPNQIIENRPQACVGETYADIIGNIRNQPMDAGFSYAAALKVANTVPTTAGSDPYSGGLAGVVYGALPTEDAPFDATTTSELYEADISNYANRPLALNFAQNGLQSLYTYSDIANYLIEYKQGVQLAVRWYSSFNTPNADGSLPPPSGSYSLHCVAVYEDTLLGLRVKPWLGPDFADHGYCYMNQTTFNLVFQSAAGFVPGNRWVNLVKILLNHWWLYFDIYPQLHS